MRSLGQNWAEMQNKSKTVDKMQLVQSLAVFLCCAALFGVARPAEIPPGNRLHYPVFFSFSSFCALIQ